MAYIVQLVARVQQHKKIISRSRTMKKISFKDTVTWLSFKKQKKNYLCYANTQKHGFYKIRMDRINYSFARLCKRV